MRDMRISVELFLSLLAQGVINVNYYFWKQQGTGEEMGTEASGHFGEGE